MPVITRSRYQKEVAPLLEKNANKQAAENKKLAKKYPWFCGHPTAKIVSIPGRMHQCQECSQSRPWEYFYVDAQLTTGT